MGKTVLRKRREKKGVQLVIAMYILCEEKALQNAHSTFFFSLCLVVTLKTPGMFVIVCVNVV